MINDILNSYLNNEKSVKINNYTLDGITRLLWHLKNPQKNFKSIHIAGTNGKGSTAYMLCAILQKSGYKTGLYTSPHLIKINERIKINSHDIDDKLLSEYISRIDSIVRSDDAISATYFDILTAAAFTYFSDEAVDVAVIETGLGGRLDSTNIITPLLSIITDISKDHINILGDTIKDITKEKCGIIKQKIPVITSNTDHQAVEIIKEYSNNNQSRLLAYDTDFHAGSIKKENNYFSFDYHAADYSLPGIKLRLFPAHQVKNASVVITALHHLKINGFPDISDNIIYEELEIIEVPGRFQIVHSKPCIIFDPAHNFDALNNLINGIEAFYPDKDKMFIISMMKDKADYNTLELFKKLNVIYFILNDERAYIPEADEFKLIVSDINIIIDLLQKTASDDLMIIFTGTFRIFNQAVFMAEYYKNSRLSG